MTFLGYNDELKNSRVMFERNTWCPLYTGRNNKYLSVIRLTVIEETAGNEILLGVFTGFNSIAENVEIHGVRYNDYVHGFAGRKLPPYILVNIYKLHHISKNFSGLSNLVYPSFLCLLFVFFFKYLPVTYSSSRKYSNTFMNV